MAFSEVKGAWFVTARRYVLQEHGEEVLARYVEALPLRSRTIVSEPVVSRWYPEEAMHDALEAFFQEVVDRDAIRFGSAMERCAVLGTHWFLQILASVTTPRYLLRLLPSALRQLRRGSVRLVVDARDDGATLRFLNHPYADHPCYRLATPAILRATLRLCVGQSARATLTHWDATTQVVEVGW
ncbi:MAG TPA: hypothetical protein VIY73_15675 [Polyangiaceae bacterium]